MSKSILLFYVLTSISVCFAQLPVKQINFPIQDPFLASVWGYLKAGGQSIDTQRYPQQELSIALPKFYQNKLPVLLNKQSKPAPLAIFIPGSFGPMDRRQPKHMTKVLLKLGYTVIRLPNTLSTEYLSAKPYHQIADFLQSTLAYTKIIAKLKKQLINQKIITSDPITILGVSHGGFLATVVTARDPKLFKRLLVFSPPINILQSTIELDQIIDENAAQICLSTIIKDLFNLIQLNYKTTLSPQEQKKFAATGKNVITFATFQQRLLFSVEKYLANQGKSSPFPSFFPNFIFSKYWQWRSRVKLTPILQQFSPQAWHSYHRPKLASIQYWADKIEQAHIPLTIVTAQDDFINAHQKWHDCNYLILLNKGSHYGYRYQKWFQQFLQKQLTQNNTSTLVK